VLTSAYFSRDFYSARAEFAKESGCRFVVFQRGLDAIHVVASNSLKAGDLMFCISKNYAAAWQARKVGGEQIATGTLSSKLHITLDPRSVSSKNVAFVSNWRPESIIKGFHGISNKSFYEPEIRDLAHLQEALKFLGFSMDIIGASNDPAEKDFFGDILGEENLSFYPKTSPYDTFNRVPLYPVVIVGNSTLGHEALSAGIPVMFLDMEGLEEFRQPFWYPANKELSHSPLLLREGQHVAWIRQIREVLRATPAVRRRLAEEVLGRDPLVSGIDTIIHKLSS